MWIFQSAKRIILSFIAVALLVAVLFWLYLNIYASMQVRAKNADIQLSHSLPTKISVGNYLQMQSIGTLDTQIALDRKLQLPLKGKYLADLQFSVEVPISVDIDYSTNIQINQTMPLEATTDLVIKNKLVPKFPLKMDIPVKLDVPFHLKRTYNIPIRINFNGPVYFEFNEKVDLHVVHQFAPQLKLNDPMTMRKIATFNATMYNAERNTKANLDMNMDLPIKNVHP